MLDLHFDNSASTTGNFPQSVRLQFFSKLVDFYIGVLGINSAKKVSEVRRMSRIYMKLEWELCNLLGIYAKFVWGWTVVLQIHSLGEILRHFPVYLRNFSKRTNHTVLVQNLHGNCRHKFTNEAISKSSLMVNVITHPNLPIVCNYLGSAIAYFIGEFLEWMDEYPE